MHMHAHQDTNAMTQQLPTFLRSTKPIDSSTQSALEETREQRVARLYAFPGGPLIGWLYDECRRRGQELRQLAEALGVTYGYINQLRSGLRLTRHISDDFAVSCARYLGVPPVVVKMVAGRIPMSDFVQPHEPVEEAMDRAMASMLDDPIARHVLPADLSGLSIEAKQGLVALYIEATGRDVLGARQLPELVRWLQRAATIHDESAGEAVRGHRDVLQEH
ncbi:helix-turn-helix domain-containing protein [Paracidovorax citrulli]|uniref:helix-turn-helix domain-containing protein n=1 Tax=Paracidovorax citrulli TaxID=80869 RepID=UPI001F1594FF|nr:helix-turn-helix transcriptional regulator [Paracidovorax citrulli]